MCGIVGYIGTREAYPILISGQKGKNVDMPRNLAKSVTVE